MDAASDITPTFDGVKRNCTLRDCIDHAADAALWFGSSAEHAPEFRCLHPTHIVWLLRSHAIRRC
jgi:hypothetical protein